MAELLRPDIVGRILGVLQDATPVPRTSSHWEGQAKRYLYQCARLYAKDTSRKDHLHRLADFASRFLPKGTDQKAIQTADQDHDNRDAIAPWAEAIENLNRDTLVVGFHILMKRQAEYVAELQAFVCDNLKTFFADPENLQPATGGRSPKSKLEDVADSLQLPLIPEMSQFRGLAEYVRQLGKGSSRDRVADIRHLAMFWQKTRAASGLHAKAKIFADALVDLAKMPHDDPRDLAFDLLQCTDEGQRFRELVLTRLGGRCALVCRGTPSAGKEDAHRLVGEYLDLAKRLLDILSLGAATAATEFCDRVLSYLEQPPPAVATPPQRKWIAEVLRELCACKPDAASRIRCLDALANVAEFVNKHDAWRQALFDSCRHEQPELPTGDYLFFQALRPVLESVAPPATGTRLDWVPENVAGIVKECAGFFSEERLERLANDFLRSVHTDKDRSDRVRRDKYVRTACWISRVCPPNDKRPELIKEASRYFVVQECEPFYSMLTEVWFGLLLVPPGKGKLTEKRRDQMASRFQQLFNEDSGRCPAGRHEDKIAENLKIMRAVVNLLSGIRC